MNQKNKLNRIYLPILLAVIIISVAFRTAAILVDFDPRTGYFEGKALVNIASAIVVCGSIALFTYAFVGAKQEKLIATFTTPSTYVPSGALVTALIFFAVKSYERIKDFDIIIEGASPKENLLYFTSNIPLYIAAALAPLAIIASVYFILNATVEERASVARATFGIGTVVFFAIYATFLYFDTTLAINAPNKIVDQMAFVFAALFFLYEIRISLGRECWHLYITFGFIAAALSAYSSIPSILLYFREDAVASHSIQENVLLLCVFIFVLSRVILAGKLNPDEESEFAIAMRERARERNKYITEKEEIEREAYLELYNRFKEIEELDESVNENELFGIVKEDTEEICVTEQTEADTETADNTETEIEFENSENVEVATEAFEEVATEPESIEKPEIAAEDDAQTEAIAEDDSKTEITVENSEKIEITVKNAEETISEAEVTEESDTVIIAETDTEIIKEPESSDREQTPKTAIPDFIEIISEENEPVEDGKDEE